jgi:TRAP-type uncharacterized transport system fused permease subunit
MGSAVNIGLSVLTSIIGVICLGSGIIGYLVKRTMIYDRILMFGAAFLLIKPGLMTDVVGLLCVALTIFIQLRKSDGPVADKVPV